MLDEAKLNHHMKAFELAVEGFPKLRFIHCYLQNIRQPWSHYRVRPNYRLWYRWTLVYAVPSLLFLFRRTAGMRPSSGIWMLDSISAEGLRLWTTIAQSVQWLGHRLDTWGVVVSHRAEERGSPPSLHTSTWAQPASYTVVTGSSCQG
jgi:hypothetical protein